MRSKELSKLMLVHRFRQVGNVKVGVVVIGEGLELRIERLLNIVSIDEL